MTASRDNPEEDKIIGGDYDKELFRFPRSDDYKDSYADTYALSVVGQNIVIDFIKNDGDHVFDPRGEAREFREQYEIISRVRLPIDQADMLTELIPEVIDQVKDHNKEEG